MGIIQNFVVILRHTYYFSSNNPMATTRKIKTALVSVFHKDGLDALLKALHNEGVQFLSTGGTHDFIVSLGLILPSSVDV